MSGLVTEEEEQEMNDKENHVNNGSDNNRSQAFFLASPVNGVSSLALVSSGGGCLLSEVQGRSVCVSCLDFSYNCLNKNLCSPGMLIRLGPIRRQAFH